MKSRQIGSYFPSPRRLLGFIRLETMYHTCLSCKISYTQVHILFTGSGGFAHR